jgi:3-oxoacyl-[acyl-carrier protein] reductase
MKKSGSRLALVVGGSRGIGRAVALRLAQSGFDLWVTYKDNHGAAQETQALVEALGRTCRLFAFDVADYAAVQAALVGPIDEHCPDVLVFNAGITRDNLLAFMTPEEWSTVLRTNLDGFFNVTQPVIYGMLHRKRGRVVVVSSIAGQAGQAGQINYAASKAGLIGAVKALVREVGRKNIYVNVVSPGVITTEMTEQVAKDQLLPFIPMQRYGTPEEVAAVVNFLCEEEHMYVQGQVIGVNGGMSM